MSYLFELKKNKKKKKRLLGSLLPLSSAFVLRMAKSGSYSGDRYFSKEHVTPYDYAFLSSCSSLQARIGFEMLGFM
jgi:hypothetical protein